MSGREGLEPRRDDGGSASSADPRRAVPALGRLLDDPALAPIIELYGRGSVTVQARRELAKLRERLDSGPLEEGVEAAARGLTEAIRDGLSSRLPPLRRVLNATGILLHTNLGRAPLGRTATAELAPLLAGYCDLEVDLASGRRDERNRRAAALLGELTGAEDALVANNNAAALVLALSVLAAGREVVVSRGELVEIGGSFRIPEVLAAAGARLVEVGTTNRTRIDDYARAIGPETAVLLKVSPSNYRISGFVAAVAPAELVALGRERGLPVVVDEGCGLLVPSEREPLRDHPSFRELIDAGCDLVCGSGDKVLSGPQAGLLAGRRELVSRCRRAPLYRALRPGRFVYAALERRLLELLRGGEGDLARLWPEPSAHRARLERLRARVGGEVASGDAFLGGGVAPEEPISGEILALPDAVGLLERLREPADGHVAVVGYRRDGRLLLDLRTVDPEDDETLSQTVTAALASR